MEPMGSEQAAEAALRLLAISWAMPPLLAPRALQVPRLLSALSDAGWQVTVLHADEEFADRGFSRDSEPGGVLGERYHSVQVGLPRPLGRLGLYRLLRRFRLDETLWERLAALEAGRRLRRTDFDVMLTFAQPWSDHRIGLRIRRRRPIPWVAHFSDPWVDNPFLTERERQRLPEQRRQEEAVIRLADAVVFTTDYTRELVMRKYPAAWREKTFVVPHAFDPDLAASIPKAASGARLRLVYAGNFYGGRTPVPLLEALAELNRSRPLREELEVLFVGAGNERYARMAAQWGLGEIAQFRPSVSFLESLRLAAQADVLLAIDAPSAEASVFLPSKLIDYLMFAKPILGITPLRGASAELLGELGCPVVAPEDIAGIRRELVELIERRKAGRLGVSPAFRSVAGRFEIQQVSRELDAILRGAAKRGRTGRREALS